eukprot:CAMPEP_0174362142 /NCGR_PEP_ID=MMETSP0811_2-20130205/62904_1 /TAXON_ID=73025 ORGANISM="Eutreptiella gymnastica-like, Strain CCMP1594" /NCGR_SAMPLE_ID=MMETSP0811_2 /ASSEMBLY_ACC=CAM_ASM_000667 /LENGTH=442 /DNA_ID=CAMNT_0015499519 /DNA_START=53 /DNA_END=1381 /DNA_ORIENTATION=+
MRAVRKHAFSKFRFLVVFIAVIGVLLCAVVWSLRAAPVTGIVLPATASQIANEQALPSESQDSDHGTAPALGAVDSMQDVCEQCNLAGKCLAGGQCSCLQGWTGPTCGVLDLVPGTAQPAFHKASRAGVTTWGASAAQAPTGEWYLFASRMVHGCGILTWSSNSEIVQATAPDVMGPYTIVKTLMPSFSHGPHLVRAPNGSYILFHIGAGDGISGVPAEACAEGSTIRPFKRPHAKKVAPGEVPSGDFWIGMAVAEALTGPWRRYGPLLGLRDGALEDMITNPSVAILPNGTALLYYRTTHRERKRTQRHIGVAVADHWAGPYRRLSRVPLFEALAEDPYVWQTGGVFHMLVHDSSSAGYSNPQKYAGKHAFSRDGLHWTVSPDVPYSATVALANGTLVLYARRERPELVVIAGRPAALITAISAQPWTRRDHGFTMVQQLR